MFKFENPYLLLFIPIIIVLFFITPKNRGITVPSIKSFLDKKIKSKKYLIGRYLMLISLILLNIGLARPQFVNENKNIQKDGIDIVLCLDLSKSMLQQDFAPNRIEVAKKIITNFVDKRVNDRIGLVVFGGEAYTKIPLTSDKNLVDEILKNLSVEDITSNDRTAIGVGLGVSLNRIKNSESKSKVIILLTDGENNFGVVSPESMANMAKDLGIKIYTVGIGAYEISMRSFFGAQMTIKNDELDETLLQYISNTTGGEYFRANDEENFSKIFETIDKLEKTKIDTNVYYEKIELYDKFIIVALILILIGIYFDYKKYIKIP